MVGSLGVVIEDHILGSSLLGCFANNFYLSFCETEKIYFPNHRTTQEKKKSCNSTVCSLIENGISIIFGKRGERLILMFEEYLKNLAYPEYLESQILYFLFLFFRIFHQFKRSWIQSWKSKLSLSEIKGLLTRAVYFRYIFQAYNSREILSWMLLVFIVPKRMFLYSLLCFLFDPCVCK